MQWADILVSVAVLVGVSAAAESGSAVLAAVFATAPTGVPLSLWLVHRAELKAAGTPGSSAEVLETFLWGCIKGLVAGVCFCAGALQLVRQVNTSLVPFRSCFTPQLTDSCSTMLHAAECWQCTSVNG